MAVENYTAVVEFVLQTFSENPQLQGTFSALFLLLYMMAFAGNCLILMAICLNSSLHTPMYFFLTNLALVDLICASTILRKFLENLVDKGTTISYGGCMTQLFFLTWVLGSELLLLTIMAYDCFVTICQPLHYNKLMSRHLCALLRGSVWVISVIKSSVHTGLMIQLNFCGPNQIHHFLCDIPTLLLFSCGPTYVNNIMVVIANGFFRVINFLLTMASYAFIIASILCIHSAEGKCQAFSTCSSHLLVVCMYYSTLIYTYILPGFGSSVENGKGVAILYTAVSPSLNPLIYTLQNRDIKVILSRVFPTYGK